MTLTVPRRHAAPPAAGVTQWLFPLKLVVKTRVKTYDKTYDSSGSCTECTTERAEPEGGACPVRARR